MNLAPIALFVYNRLDHLKKTIHSLAKNKLASDSNLYIFSDGPKNNEDLNKVQEVRSFISTITDFKKLTIIESSSNKGLASSIIDGVTDIVNQYGRIIVLEDDMLTSPYFLDFMNQGLELYDLDKNVASIHGYMYPVNDLLPETFFLRGADCWGWATWKDRWSIFEPNGSVLLNQLKITNQLNKFDFDGAYPYVKMLKDQIDGKNDSWAIRWYASAFLKNMLTLYPSKAFVKNIGFDGSGTHCSSSNTYDVLINLLGYHPLEKIQVNESLMARNAIISFFKPRKNFIEQIKLLPKKRKKYGWLEEYDDWKAVEAISTGYDDTLILEACHRALSAVKNGEALHERDSVLFDTIEYSWPLLSALLYVYSLNRYLSVLDFRGSLGSTYFQNRKFLSGIDLVWSVVEQSHFVAAGKRDFEDNRLMYFDSVESCIKKNKSNVLILSSVIQYFEFPYQQLEDLLCYPYECVIVDRTPFNRQQKESIRLQVVPPEIYPASYPCWFFDESKFLDFFKNKGYHLMEEFKALDGESKDYRFKGFIFKKNSHNV